MQHASTGIWVEIVIVKLCNKLKHNDILLEVQSSLLTETIQRSKKKVWSSKITHKPVDSESETALKHYQMPPQF